MAETGAPEAFPTNGTGSDETAEDRLEAALDRIAKVLEAPDPVAIEVAERLDRMIARLRSALDKE